MRKDLENSRVSHVDIGGRTFQTEGVADTKSQACLGCQMNSMAASLGRMRGERKDMSSERYTEVIKG